MHLVPVAEFLVTRCVYFSSKRIKVRFTAGLHPDPLSELTELYLDLGGLGMGRERGRGELEGMEKLEGRRERGRKG